MKDITIEIVTEWLESKPKAWFWDDDPNKAVEDFVVVDIDSSGRLSFYGACVGWCLNCSLKKPIKCNVLTPIEAAIKLDKEGPFDCEVSYDGTEWEEETVTCVRVGKEEFPFDTGWGVYRHCRTKE